MPRRPTRKVTRASSWTWRSRFPGGRELEVTAPRSQILDACVLINLLASGEIEAVLGAAARASFVCVAVEKEALYLRTDDPSSPLELIRLTPHIEAGLLTVCDIEGDEEARLYVDYASALDDGEAM